MASPSPDRDREVREKLQGYPDGTAEDVLQYLNHGTVEALDRALVRILQFHLPPVPQGEKPNVATLPGTTRLMEDLQIDSLAFAEMAFVLEEVLAVRVPDEELLTLKSIDDFRACIQRLAQTA